MRRETCFCLCPSRVLPATAPFRPILSRPVSSPLLPFRPVPLRFVAFSSVRCDAMRMLCVGLAPGRWPATARRSAPAPAHSPVVLFLRVASRRVASRRARASYLIFNIGGAALKSHFLASELLVQISLCIQGIAPVSRQHDTSRYLLRRTVLYCRLLVRVRVRLRVHLRVTVLYCTIQKLAFQFHGCNVLLCNLLFEN